MSEIHVVHFAMHERAEIVVLLAEYQRRVYHDAIDGQVETLGTHL